MPNEKDEHLVYGTYEQIKAELVRLKNQQIMLKNLQVEGSGGVESRALPIGYKGKIAIKILFEGTTINGKRHAVEKSFRLMDDDARTISLDRIKALGNLVASKFNGLTFSTGKITYTYNDIDSGFSNMWGYFKSLIDAQRVFEQMLDIVGKSPNWKLLSSSNHPIPEDLYQDPGNKVQQIGVQIREDVLRPEALMRMKKSMIKFPKIKKWQDLTNSNALVMHNLDWLKKYQD